MNDLVVQMWPVEKPVPYARNSRKIPERAVDKVAASIKEFGFRVPIVVDKDGVIICGHTRLLAAKKLGLKKVPVHVAANLSPAQVKAYRLMDNRSHEDTDWDFDLLGPELAELQALDFDLELTGFSPGEIDKFLLDPMDEDRANAVPPLPENAVSALGDVWVCGEHRVLCGDATSREAITRLLGKLKPRLMVTDPPYGISLDSEWRDRARLNGLGPAEPSYMKKRTAGHTETSISGEGMLRSEVHKRALARFWRTVGYSGRLRHRTFPDRNDLGCISKNAAPFRSGVGQGGIAGGYFAMW